MLLMEKEGDKFLRIVGVFNGARENWSRWKMKFTALLIHYDMTDFIMSKVPDDSAAEDVKDQWVSKNRKLWSTLVLYTESTAAAIVQGCYMDGIGAWRALLKKYEAQDMESMLTLQGELYECKLGKNEDPDDYFYRIDTMRWRLRDMGVKFSDAQMAGLVVHNLSRSYGAFKAMVNFHGVAGYDELKEKIKVYHRLIQERLKEEEKHARQERAFMVTCYACGKEGHKAEVCPELKGDPSACWGCGKGGHQRSECPNRKKSIEDGEKAGGDENDKKKKNDKAYVSVKDGMKHVHL